MDPFVLPWRENSDEDNAGTSLPWSSFGSQISVHDCLNSSSDAPAVSLPVSKTQQAQQHVIK
jgi:hypothetical protein